MTDWNKIEWVDPPSLRPSKCDDDNFDQLAANLQAKVGNWARVGKKLNKTEAYRLRARIGGGNSKCPQAEAFRSGTYEAVVRTDKRTNCSDVYARCTKAGPGPIVIMQQQSVPASPSDPQRMAS